MSQNRTPLKKNILKILVVFILLLTVAAAFAYRSGREETAAPKATEYTPSTDPVVASVPPAESAALRDSTSAAERPAPVDGVEKAVFRVENMSCSGCISTIKGSLANIQGIRDVVVDVSGGRAEVYYDNRELDDTARIADAITDSGYPAALQSVLSADALKKEADLAATKSRYYVASVGGWDIARSDFSMEMENAIRRYTKVYGDEVLNSSRGAGLQESLKRQIIGRLLEEGIVMQEITKADYKLDPEAVEREFQTYVQDQGSDLETFRARLQEAGYEFEYFRKKFETRALINRYLREEVLAAAANEREKGTLLNAWFRNAKALAEVVYYDQDLKQLAQKQGAAGGCCATN